MSYYQGSSALPVKPVTRRATFTRGQAPRNEKKYLQTNGRKPLNRRGYPSAGVPVAATPTLGWWNDIPMARNPGEQLGAYGLEHISLTVKPRRGRPITTRPFEGGAFMTAPIGPNGLGAETPAGYGLAPLSVIQRAISPSIPSVVTAPVPSTVWNPITSLLNLWDARPQVLKDIRLSVNPNQAMRALQTVVKPGQISGAVDQLQRWGVNTSYQGVPVSGTMAGYGYEAAGFDFQKALPWILGGGALLFVIPMLTKKR